MIYKWQSQGRGAGVPTPSMMVIFNYVFLKTSLGVYVVIHPPENGAPPDI